MFPHEDEHVRVKLQDRTGPTRGILAEQGGLDSLIKPATPRGACGTSRLASSTRNGHMTECFLAAEEIRKLNTDLRILVATNGTLTRILGMVADEEIIVQIIKQQIHRVPRETAESGQLSGGRILQRHVLLKGRSSGHLFVAAESVIAIDLLPRTITASLTRTECPIGEIMAAGRLETFKEPADVWIGESPDWLALAGYQTSQPRIVGRRYRIIMGGQPVIIITEYFLESFSRIRSRDEPDVPLTSERHKYTVSE
jgi:chorismate--pyruvate lyase